MSPDVVAVAEVRVPATCGELLQGVDDCGPVLVSLPVDRWGTVGVELTPEAVIALTPDLPKSRAALHLALDRVGWRGGALVRLGGEIAPSLGMGSSTVDVAGVIGGVCRAAGVELSSEDLVQLCAQVEPSDSSPLAGLWAIDHVSGRRATPLAPVPSDWWLVAVDSGEAVRTLDVHRRCGAGPRLPAGLLDRAQWADPASIARAATESALRNQVRLPHPAFDAVYGCARRLGAGGVCVAHSGSLCAVICQGPGQAGDARALLAAEGLRSDVMKALGAGIQVHVRARVPS